MLNLGSSMSFFLISFIGNNKNPPITDEICWSLDFRYCGVQLYSNFRFSAPSFKFQSAPNSAPVHPQGITPPLGGSAREKISFFAMRTKLRILEYIFLCSFLFFLSGSIELNEISFSFFLFLLDLDVFMVGYDSWESPLDVLRTSDIRCVLGDCFRTCPDAILLKFSPKS